MIETASIKGEEKESELSDNIRRTTISGPKDLFKQAEEKAKEGHRSFSGYIAALIERDIKEGG
jgi:hypothetical protein